MKNQNGMANSVDPDKTAHDEPSHQDIQCLQNTVDSLYLKHQGTRIFNLR